MTAPPVTYRPASCLSARSLNATHTCDATDILINNPIRYVNSVAARATCGQCVRAGRPSPHAGGAKEGARRRFALWPRKTNLLLPV